MFSIIISSLLSKNTVTSFRCTTSATSLRRQNTSTYIDVLQSSPVYRSRNPSRLYSSSDSVINNGGTTSSSTDDIDDISTTKQAWQTNPRAKWSTRKHRKRLKTEEKLRKEKNDGLSWEKFDFGESPKMDSRFDEDGSSSSDEVGIPESVLNTISTDSITYQTYLKSESKLDDNTSKQSLKTQSELLSLDPELVQKSIDILTPYIQERRLERINEVLNQRTRHTRFLFENPSNPSNVWACLRTLDSFGIQYVDVIVHSESYLGKAAVSQKRGMRTAMGSAMWMTIRQFSSLAEAIKTLKEEEGCLIYASDLNPTAKDVRDLTWDVDFDTDENDNTSNGESKDQRPICIVMGNEEGGISNEMRELADETFYLPMSGFAESFNLSVATSITLAYMSAVSGRGSETSECKGPLRPGDLHSHELQCLKLKGVLNSIAQKRTAKALLRKEGIELPSSLYNS